MAKHFPATPVITGKDAEIIQNEILNGTPDTPERVAMIKAADEIFLKCWSGWHGYSTTCR